MKRRLLAVLLCAALLASAVFCAGAAVFFDTQDHWAAAYIDEATSRQLFAGMDEQHFSPDTDMTRAMFVTVLARVAGVEPTDYDPQFLASYFTDVNVHSYYAPFVAWAVFSGVTDGVGDGRFAPDMAVSREQMARFLHSYLILCGNLPDEAAQTAATIPPLPEELRRPTFVPQRRVSIRDSRELSAEEPAFSDAEQIADWARSSVELLRSSGLLAGLPDGMGGYAFQPKKTATRAEGAVVFCKLQDMTAGDTLPQPLAVSQLVLNLDSTELEVDATMPLSATVFPLEADNQRIVWYSTDREVVSVDANGLITGISEGEAEVRARTADGSEACCAITVIAKPEPVYLPDPDLYAPTSWDEKCMLIFGEVMRDPRLAYADGEEAKQHMTTVKVPAWDIGADGERFTRYFYLEVHENVAALVTQIFYEIYALPEQVPIHSLGGYRWDGKCEHSIGLAIDINAAENYYCTPDGKAIVGKYFKPGEDPYSIPVMGAVDQIFANYGFKRGIYWGSGYKDYMHYSYFGT